MGRFLTGTYENIATHFDCSKTVGFSFLLGLAPGLWDGFSIERYENKHEIFHLFAAKFESGAGALSKQAFLPCPSIIRNSKWPT